MVIKKKKPVKRKMPKSLSKQEPSQVVTKTKEITTYVIGRPNPLDKFKAKDWLALQQHIQDYCTEKKLPNTWSKIEKLFDKLSSAYLSANKDQAKKEAQKLADFFEIVQKPKIQTLAEQLPKLLKKAKKQVSIDMQAHIKESFKAKYDELKESKGFDNQGDFIQYLLTLADE